MTRRQAPRPPARTNGPADPPVIEMRAVGVSYPGQLQPIPPDPPGDAPAGARRTGRVAGVLPRRREPARHRLYGLEPAALDHVDLIVRAGEMVTVTGPARSGTTTLLHVAGLLLRPTTGSYLLNGLDTARMGDRDRSALRGQEIGLIFQPPRLLPDRSALDNVALPLLYVGAPGGLRTNVAMECLDRVGLAARARRMAADLSAGERQRVAIARALVITPSLLVCDDPTAGLDAGQSAQVVGLLTALRSDGTTILAATRDQLATAYSSRCVTIGARHPADAGASR